MLLYEAFGFFRQVSPFAFLGGTKWTPLFQPQNFGVLPLLSGSLLIALGAAAVALPVGLLSAIYLSEYASPRMRGILKPAFEVLAGIPTIVFGYFVDGEIRAAAELRKLSDNWGVEAEAAFSVERAYQDQGIGSALMGRIIRSARNRGVKLLFMSCLAENAKMQAIAKKHEADLRFEYGEVIGEIIPSGPDYFSLLAEAADDRVGYMMAVLDLSSRLVKAA